MTTTHGHRVGISSHFRRQDAHVAPLPRAQDVGLAEPDPAAAEDRPRPPPLAVGLGRLRQQPQPRFRGGRRRGDVGRPQERIERAGRHRQGR